MNPDQSERILREHIRLCSDLRDLFIDEGKIMRSTGLPPDEAFLERKQQFLPALDKGLELLQRINEDPDSFDRSLSPLVEEARAQVMKLMMLDRENERLLLKSTLPPKMKEAYGKAAAGQVAKAYARYGQK